MSPSRLVLGTVQLGMSYGIANKLGRPDTATATDIVSTAWKGGITCFDTAQAYGDSELVLGECFKTLGISNLVKVVSKLPPDVNAADSAAILQCLDKSFERLGVAMLYGLMLHREEMLDQWNNGLGQVLMKLKSAGRVQRIGVSCYTPERAMQAMQIPGVDLLQIPANLFDRRFETAGIAKQAEKNSCELHIRSVFLQGLLLIRPEELNGLMGFAKPTVSLFAELSMKNHVTQQEVALHYIRSRWPLARIVFGAETQSQVQSNINCWKKKSNPGVLTLFEEHFADVNDRIILPNRWPK